MILQLNQSKQANKETESLEKLIAGCRSGDSCDQFEMFNSLAPKMRAVINRYIKNRADAEDVLIIGLTRVLLKIDTYQGIGSFEGWVKKIVTNLALSTLAKRGQQLQIVYSTDLGMYNPSYQLSEMDHLMQALDSLPKYLSKPFILFSIEGYSHKEIGRKLSISETLSRVRVLRAKRLMQDRLLIREQILKKTYKVS